MPNALAQLGEAARRNAEYNHPSFTPPDLPGYDAITAWGRGVKQRTLHPLEALAQASQEMMNASPTDTALNWSNPVAGGLAGIFAGVGAKTADVAKLGLAQKLKQAGVPDREIHAQTGWTFGFADGKPRFEIPDNASMYRGTLSGNRAGDAVHHPELFAAHPQLRDINVREFQGEGGSLNPVGVGQMNIGVGSTDAHSTALHELQHAIQQREGFARGGSPDNAPIPFMDEISAIRTAKNQLNIDPYQIQNKRAGGYPLQQYEVDRYKQWEELTAKEDDLLAKSHNVSPYEAYKRLAGETEARLTQARMNLTSEQRLLSYPLDMMDVPVEQQIVRYGDVQAMSVPKTVYRAGGVSGLTSERGGPTFYATEKNGALPYSQGDAANIKEYQINPIDTFDTHNLNHRDIYEQFMNETGHPARYGQTGLPFWTSENSLKPWLDSKGHNFDSIMFDENTGVPSYAIYKKP